MSVKGKVFSGVLLFTISVLVVIVGSTTSQRRLKDPKADKYKYEIVLLFDETFAYENYISCPDCGLTHYMHVKMTVSDGKPIAMIHFWDNRVETMKNRRRIFGNNNPFDPFNGMGVAGER